jgi:hypothetical protein
MLKTEQDTPSMRRKVERAARVYFRQRKGVQADFEHGQWWITLRDGSQYSVCDAEGPTVTHGFCFEQVTAPQG